MKTWQSVLFGVVLGLFAGIIITTIFILVSRQPDGDPIQLNPAPTPAPILIQIIGEVAQPGLYELPGGSRVNDAIQKAGGFTNVADRSALNLASHLRDGDRVIVPSLLKIGSDENGIDGGNADVNKHSGEIPTINYPIDLNTATTEDLDTLPGIGMVRAQDIIRYREEHGFFNNINELKNVKGIGDSTFEQIKDLVTVNP